MINYQLVIDYINKTYDRNVKKSVMYDKISMWKAWLEGTVEGFHTFHKKMDLNDENKVSTLHRNRTNMLLKGAEDWASILLNEKTRVTIDDKQSELFVMGEDQISGVFGENDFWRCANELVATSRWSGTGAFEVYIRQMEVEEGTGKLISGDSIGINYLSAEQIIPISFDNGIMHEAAFISERTIRGKVVFLVSIHLLNEEGTYDIESFYLDEYGTRIEAENRGMLVHTGSPYPWFSIVRKSGVNVFDYDSPFGVSIVSGAEDILRGLDCAFDNFITDFKLGRKMVLMSSSMFNTTEEGKVIAPQEYEEQLFINAGDKVLDGGMYQEYNPSLRVAENAAGLQKMLDMFSLRIGLGAKRYAVDISSGMPTTATQWVGERQELVQNATKEMICIERALKEVVHAILWIGKNVLGEKVNPDALITIIADDSYIIDKDTERAQWLQDLQLGIRSKAEYRAHFYGESIKDAEKKVTPSLAELIQGMQVGAVSLKEVRKFLFPYETEKQAEEALAEIKNQNTQTQDEAFAKSLSQENERKAASRGGYGDSEPVALEGEVQDSEVPFNQGG